MIERISIENYLTQYSNIPIIDVRSPGEFEKGHIPGAFNIALFSNEERAEVGTVYKQRSKEKAIELGYKFVTPKLDYFIEASVEIAPDKVIAVHCWRGGMRSQSFAEHLEGNGFHKVYVIEKGYKAYRNYVLSFFENSFKLRILGGFTGSGKTDILDKLVEMGEQVVDLENMAHHKGSAFGGIGQKVQPSVEFFENNLFTQLNQLDISKPIWVEDESMNIGRIIIPRFFFQQMRDQRVYFIDIPRRERAHYLVQTYGIQNKEELHESILRISKRLGPQNTKQAIEALKQDDLLAVAEITLVYYDKTYHKGLDSRNPELISKIAMEKVDAGKNAELLLKNILD